MPFLNFEDADEPKTESWNEIQSHIGSSDVNYSDEPITRTAGGPMEQAVRSVTDTLWAGSATINEQFELERHMKTLIDEGCIFPVIEKRLKAYGYMPAKIRRVFQKLTNVDPVVAYLDPATYTVPPDAVPRYNYGWGPSKDKKADYFFILPFLNKYAIYKQTALEREIVAEHVSVLIAQDELKKFVKDVRVVSADSLDMDTDIIQRVASLQVPAFENPEAMKLATEVSRLKSLGEFEMPKKLIVDALQEGLISTTEHAQLLCYADAEDPSEMSGEDKERQKALEKYQMEQEGTTVEDEVGRLKLPQDDFHQLLEEDNKVDMKDLTNDAYDLLQEIAASVPGYTITPVGSRVDLMDVEAYSSDDSNHIDSGSIRFLVNMVDTKTQEELKALVIMFVVNGHLQYSGKFKGGDNREYALSTPGLHAYFDSVQGKPVEDLHYTPQATPQSESMAPYK